MKILTLALCAVAVSLSGCYKLPGSNAEQTQYEDRGEVDLIKAWEKTHQPPNPEKSTEFKSR